ncbi:MAG TPA: rhodanese-like domain-containing protein [Reyranella sp.]|jgi:glyoxylase-like metal-dependent hydrolase (beta-lactamase superfamily II)|nr:rhodanese-like domain-containing protein [Reyranella sp.]
MLVFRQLFDPTSSTYTYLLGDSTTGEAVLIDPVFEQVRRDAALVSELGLRLLWTLETHVHADHITGAWLLKQRLGSRIALAEAAGATGADRALKDGDRVAFGKRTVEVRATPGHTNGCLTFVLDDESMAFTGDCVLIRGSGRTDFQQGDARALYRSVRSRIFSLPETCLLYPAHDYRGLTVTSVAEEKKFSPRLGGEIAEADYVGYMQNLDLPHPKKIDEAVPANLRCGQPGNGAAALSDPEWAPLRFTFSGVWEVEPHWLEENLGSVRVLDVREPNEFTGPLGHIRGALLVPLGELAAKAKDLPRDKPIVAVCRAGSRSAHATAILNKAGFTDVANLPGGMLRWRGEGRSVDGGAT